MAHHEGGTVWTTWPFRVAGTLVMAALSFFCLRFALEDVGRETEHFWPIFWGAIIISLALTLLGAVVNYSRYQKRQSG